jgi:hypothetical protein
MSSVGERLKSYWISIGTKVRPGASHEAIQSFEAAHGVRLSQDLSDYYQSVDGMAEGQTDNDMLEFLPLNSLKSITEELIEFGGIPDYRGLRESLPDPYQCFVIIDYMIRSHVYAVRLSHDPLAVTPVIWICGPHWEVIAPSFSDFGERYLLDRTAILFPPKEMRLSGR